MPGIPNIVHPITSYLFLSRLSAPLVLKNTLSFASVRDVKEKINEKSIFLL
jgi:hypothetical protein